MISVRVSTDRGPAADLDLAACAPARSLTSLIVPKAEDPEVVAAFGRRMDVHGLPEQCGVILGIETARGVADILELVRSSDRIVGLYFGAEDFISSMRGRRTPAGLEVLHARSKVVLAARAAGCFALDQALPDF